MTTEEVARAFLQKPTTLAQRTVRAKSKIREAGIPYEVPETTQLAKRPYSVLQVIYLIFNEGYSASNVELLVKHDLASEAIRLGRLLAQLLPGRFIGINAVTGFEARVTVGCLWRSDYPE